MNRRQAENTMLTTWIRRCRRHSIETIRSYCTRASKKQEDRLMKLNKMIMVWAKLVIKAISRRKCIKFKTIKHQKRYIILLKWSLKLQIESIAHFLSFWSEMKLHPVFRKWNKCKKWYRNSIQSMRKKKGNPSCRRISTYREKPNL